jgi:hemolysin activation/secretion protein
LSCATLAPHALAQVLPPTIDPGRIQDRLDPPRAPQRPLRLPELKDPKTGPSESVKAMQVTLRSVRIEGASTRAAAPLQAHVDQLIGREISVGRIFELAGELTALYRREGYILSQVIVPPQTLTDGALTLRVVEGYIAEVRIEGEADEAAKRSLAALGEKIKASRPLHASDLERYLLNANDLPGIQLRSVLTPSKTPGAADLVLIATQKRVDGFVSLDNYGSVYLGPGQLSGALSINRLLGDDQLRILGTGAGDSEMGYGELAYSRVLNSEGLRLGASASTTHTRPGDVLKPLEIRGRADAASLSLGYPLLRTRNSSVLGRALLDYRDVDSDLLGFRVIEDRIRALRVGLTWLQLDRLDGYNTFTVEVSQGMGGTKQEDILKSRIGADGKFSKATFDYERVQPLGGNFSVTLGMGGQWTSEPLLSSEQFALGGRRFGRAYDPAELAGDRALGLRMEPAYTGRGGWLQSWQLYGFWDGGQVWYQDDPNLTIPRESESLAAAGFGVRLFGSRYLSATLEAAWPLTRPVASQVPDNKGNDVRILGSIVARF